jgi:hypothetical protein
MTGYLIHVANWCVFYCDDEVKADVYYPQIWFIWRETVRPKIGGIGPPLSVTLYFLIPSTLY